LVPPSHQPTDLLHKVLHKNGAQSSDRESSEAWGVALAAPDGRVGGWGAFDGTLARELHVDHEQLINYLGVYFFSGSLGGDEIHENEYTSMNQIRPQ